ncbi:MAG: hypothetical protein Q7S12_03185 [bacterium]|nr:hypothetical protein [bacterium]
MKRNLLLILSYLLFATGLIILGYALHLSFSPRYEIKVEAMPLPKAVSRWDKDIICSRVAPTPLFLNFYGNTKEQWIAVLFGREREIARIFIFPKRQDGQNIVRYANTQKGLKELSKLDEAEFANYQKNLAFAGDEENFFTACLEKAFAYKFDI